MIRVLLRAFAVTLCVTAMLAPAANAHAVLVGSSPTDGARLDHAPSVVTLTFDEPVTLVPDSAKVLSDDGTRADNGHATLAQHGDTIDIPLRPGLPIGSYAVTWRVVSADTHIVSGSIRFGIGIAPTGASMTTPSNHTGPLDVAADTAQGLVYLGLVLGFGVAVAATCWWRWTARLRRVRRMIRTGWAICFAGTAGQLLLLGPQADNAGWSGFLRWGDVTRTAASLVGLILIARLVLLAALCAVTLSPHGRSRRSAYAALIAGVEVLITVALIGHESPTAANWTATTVALLHVATMAVWLGGLTLLATVVLPRLRELRRDGRSTALGRAASRYLASWSRIAFGCVAVLVLSGEYLGWRQVEPVPSLWSTRYGLILLIKLGLVAAMAGVAWRTQRRLAALAPIFGDIARNVWLETGLAVAVLAVTTVLVSQPPARTTYGPPVDLTAPLGSDTAEIHVDTTRHGRQVFTIAVRDQAGAAVSIDAVSARLSSADAGVAALTVPVDRDAHDPTRWHSNDAVVPLPGRWTLTLTVTPAGRDAFVTSADYPVW